MFQLAGGGHHHAVAGVILADEIGDRGAAHPSDGFGSAKDRPADRLVGKGGFLEVVENNIVGGVGGLPDFLEDHRPFARQFGFIEQRVL